MINGFKEFILRGNVLDLAVAVVIGAAFSAVVTSVVQNIINPLIGAVFQADSLSGWLIWHLGKADVKFGALLGTLIQFFIVAVVVYFVFVYPLNLFKARAAKRKAEGEPEKTGVPVTELDVLTQIRDLIAQDREPVAGKHSGDL